ncbi:MAG: class I SAM-dependent methyltransferase [Syntrophales bacterium]|jgi:methyltransferase (TIGR00027 family)
MKIGFPSKTAQSVAIRRAEHQLFDFPHVLEDPIAPWIIGPEAATSIIFRWWTVYLPISRYTRAFMAARSRYAEDQLARVIASGTTQYVILGAGLDTFPYRNPYSKYGLRVFEVDHPNTQAWKRRRLALAAIPVPSSVTFVPVDFEHQRLEVELDRAGFRLDKPAFFSWLGVTPYLPNEAVMATFTLIHSLCPENAIAFDYALPRQVLSGGEKMAFDVLSKSVDQISEPFRGFFRPEVLVNDLKKIGFRRVENFTTDQINALYFRNRLDGLRIRGSLGRLMCAY